jgi:hypothetical protein
MATHPQLGGKDVTLWPPHGLDLRHAVRPDRNRPRSCRRVPAPAEPRSTTPYPVRGGGVHRLRIDLSADVHGLGRVQNGRGPARPGGGRPGAPPPPGGPPPGAPPGRAAPPPPAPPNRKSRLTSTSSAPVARWRSPSATPSPRAERSTSIPLFRRHTGRVFYWTTSRGAIEAIRRAGSSRRRRPYSRYCVIGRSRTYL